MLAQAYLGLESSKLSSVSRMKMIQSFRLAHAIPEGHDVLLHSTARLPLRKETYGVRARPISKKSLENISKHTIWP